MGQNERRANACPLFRMDGNGRRFELSATKLRWKDLREDGEEIRVRRRADPPEHALREEPDHAGREKFFCRAAASARLGRPVFDGWSRTMYDTPALLFRAYEPHRVGHP